MHDYPLLILAAVLASSGGAHAACGDTRYRTIDEKLSSGDGQGHGPDIGSDEWKSVIEFKLGMPDKAELPDRNSEGWCDYVDRLLEARAAVAGSAPGPSFACDEAVPEGVAAMVCADHGLAALDNKLADVYAAASRKAGNEHPPRLKAEQRGWIKGRDECWKSEDQRACVQGEYTRRIAELQARYRLVPASGPVRFICEGNAANEVIVTYFETDPPTLVAERGDGVSLMYLQPGSDGAKYRGPNESILERRGEVLIQWGYGTAVMKCVRHP